MWIRSERDASAGFPGGTATNAGNLPILSVLGGFVMNVTIPRRFRAGPPLIQVIYLF